MKQLLIASTSTLHNQNHLEYLLPELELFFQQTDEILFIPYARPSGISHENYTQKVQIPFSKIGKSIHSIHQFKEPVQAIEKAKGIFTGGGNTFLLVKSLYKNEIMAPLRKAILKGTPYLGTSAGSNICGLTMQTTNDMPIVYPPSFKTLGVVPFNINPHYLDPNPNSSHMGETRETRIQEFHTQNEIPVVGLREGSWLQVKGGEIILKGNQSARLFSLQNYFTSFYLDPNPNSSHMGETRETRIQEFHTQNEIPVVGLREGSWLQVKGGEIILKGNQSARLFEYNKAPFEIESGSKIEYI